MSLTDVEIALGSGMNDTLHEAMLGDAESPLVRNWIPKGEEFQTREGSIFVHGTAADQRLLTPFAFRTNLQTEYLLCAGSKDQVKKQSGAGFINIPQQGVHMASGGEVPGNDFWNWFFVTKGLVTYGCRRGMLDSIVNVGRVYHITKDRVTKAGTAAPTQAPTVLESSGAGLLPAGTWLCAYTFVLDSGSADETESDLSPTTSVTTAALKKRDWANIQTSLHPRCNARRLYVSVDGGETLFFVTQIVNDASDSVTEQVLQADYEDEAAVGLTFPPVNPEVLIEWDGKLWVHDGKTMWQSEPGKRENFDPLKSFTINRPPNTPSRLRGLLPWDGSRLAVGMDYSMHYLVVDDSKITGYRVEDVSTNIGLASANGMCVGSSTLFYYSGFQVWATTGGDPICISDKRVQKTLERIPLSMRERAVMTYDERHGRVLLSFASKAPTSTENDLILAFSTVDNKWSFLSYYDSEDGATRFAPQWMGYVPAPLPYNLKYIAATFSNMNRVMSLESTSNQDQGVANSELVRHEFISAARQAQGMALCVRRIRLALAQKLPTGPDAGGLPGESQGTFQATVSLRLDGNRETTPRVVTIGSEWTPINIDNLDDPARTVSVHVVIRANRRLSCYGLVLETVLLKSRIGTAA